jgi:Cys-tRNA(Pro)/Cys-tRNA(Cys) deacylase
MDKQTVKTIVMRILEQKKIPYVLKTYDSSLTEGAKIAVVLQEDPSRVYKTLVLIGSDKKNYVVCVPVLSQIDEKKLAKKLNIKSISMILQKELQPLTGYVHGGCSPIGMKKHFTTIFDSSMENCEAIYISGGLCGVQVQLKVQDLQKLVDARFEEVTANEK